jgi:hypothetical protein
MTGTSQQGAEPRPLHEWLSESRETFIKPAVAAPSHTCAVMGRLKGTAKRFWKMILIL